MEREKGGCIFLDLALRQGVCGGGGGEKKTEVMQVFGAKPSEKRGGNYLVALFCLFAPSPLQNDSTKIHPPL